MQMDSKEAAVHPSQDAAEESAIEAAVTESKTISTESEALTEQPIHEGSFHSNGGTSAEQAPKPALPAPQADMGDAELQCRKAALLQRVWFLHTCQHACSGTCHTTVVDNACLRISMLTSLSFCL